MSRQIQFRRGTADEHKNFTGAEGEITVDLTNKTLRVHDGVTPGGIILARADAEPTSTTKLWISEEYTPITATRTIAVHNLNLNPLEARGDVLLKCVSADAGYQPGEYCSNWTPSGQNGNLAFPICRGVTVTQNTIETMTGTQTIAALKKDGSNEYAFLVLSKWRYIFRIFY